MSCNYADGLSPYHDKGQLGLEEKFDTKHLVTAKVALLTKWINSSKHVVIHTGAGISTAAGIPDFRGPRGVWTLQAKGEKPDLSKDFHEAIPTVTHMAITKLVEKGKVKYVVSQNIDGLHLRSNLGRKYLSELHGNMFTEQCSACNRQFVRNTPVPSVGQKPLNKVCPTTKANGRPCRGKLHDTILDWEHNLPENDLGMADYHSSLADLSICLGTTMQIVPSGNLPLYTKRHGGTLVIINLQPTKHDRKADLIIHAYVDEVMTMLMKNLNIKIPKYNQKNDPTRTLTLSSDKFLEWTITDSMLREMKEIFEARCGAKEARKRLEMIDDDLPVTFTKHVKRKGKEDEDSDLEVLDVIVKPKRTRESTKRGAKKNSTTVYNTTITIKKVTPAPKKAKYDGEKITIKKNVTPTKTKYEIVTKPKKTPKCEIVYETDGDLCNDLDMICESDDDEMTNNFTYNFKRYLHDDVKKERQKDSKEENAEVKTEVKNEIKVEENMEMKKEIEEPVKEVNKTEPDMGEDGGNSTEKEKEEKGEVAVNSEDKTKDSEETPNQEQTKKPTEVMENADSSKDIFEKGSVETENTGEKMDESSVEITGEKLSKDDKEEEKGKENASEDISGKSNQVEEEGKEIANEDISGKGNQVEESEQVQPENTPMEVDTVECQAQTTTSNDQELEKLLEMTEKEKHNERKNGSGDDNEEETVTTHTQKENSLDKSKENSNNKIENLRNIESELSSLSNSNLESQIDQMVNQGASSSTQSFENTLELSSCGMNSSINENYEFYGNEYNSTNNPTDMDYTDTNYYNNF